MLNFILMSHTMLNYLPVFLYFIKVFFVTGAQRYTVSVELPSCILSTFLSYNKDILISNKPIYFKHFSNNHLNYVTQLLYDTGNTKEWVKLKHEFNLNKNFYFNWMNFIHLIPQKWKNIIKNNRISKNLLLLNHHLVKSNILLSLEKNSKELYLIQLTFDFCKSTSKIYFEKHFNNCVLGWKYIYIPSCIVNSDPYTRYFQ